MDKINEKSNLKMTSRWCKKLQKRVKILFSNN